MIDTDEGIILEFDLRGMSGFYVEHESEEEEEVEQGRGHNLYEGIEDEIEKMDQEMKEEQEKEQIEPGSGEQGEEELSEKEVH